MSPVTIPVYHYALLKGYMAGQNAPSEVLAAVEALYGAAIQGPLRNDALEAIQAVREAAERLAGIAVPAAPVGEETKAERSIVVAIPESKEIVLPPLTTRALEKADERADTLVASIQPQTDEAKIATFLAAKTVEQCPPANAAGGDREVVVGSPSDPKKRKEWSPEARAAAAERMRARQAAGLMKGRKTESDAALSAEPTTIAPEPQPPHRLTVAHPGYAGMREDGQLIDEDWPHIKARLAQGDSLRSIAGDYDAEMEDLDFFITSNQRREAKQPPGEARAPL